MGYGILSWHCASCERHFLLPLLLLLEILIEIEGIFRFLLVTRQSIVRNAVGILVVPVVLNKQIIILIIIN